jgi:integrase
MPRKRANDGLTKRPDGTYHFDKGKKEKRVYIATGKTDRREARLVVSQELKRRGIEASYFKTRRFPPARAPLPSALTLGNVHSAWLTRQKSTYTNEINLKNLIMWSQRLVDELGPDSQISKLDIHHLRKIAIRHRERGLADATVRKMVVEPIRGMYNLASTELGATDLPFIKWSTISRIPRNARSRYLRAAEMESIIRECTDRDAFLHEFAWLTGIRIRSIIDLRWTDIDFDLGLITAARKGGGTYTVPLTPDTRRLLEAVRGHPTHVFTWTCRQTAARKPFTYSALAKRAAETFRRAGVQDYRLHDHRHTAACLAFVASGFNIYAVQELLGHASKDSTDRYVHLDKARLRADLGKVTSWESPGPVAKAARSPFFSDGPPALSIAYARANDNVERPRT